MSRFELTEVIPGEYGVVLKLNDENNIEYGYIYNGALNINELNKLISKTISFSAKGTSLEDIKTEETENKEER